MEIRTTFKNRYNLSKLSQIHSFLYKCLSGIKVNLKSFPAEWGLEFKPKGLTVHLEHITKVWHFKHHCNPWKTLCQTISTHNFKLYVIVSEHKFNEITCHDVPVDTKFPPSRIVVQSIHIAARNMLHP